MLSALELARRISTGELTPRHVIDRCADAIARHEREVGAFAALDLAAARQRTEVPGLAQTPLRGLPVGVKDTFDTVDFPTEHGAPSLYASHRPLADAAMVALIRRAGGIVPGKTVTTEFASFQPAGTRNPRNLAHTPGGSSSGSAAAVAAGMLPLAIGSQTGGSVIRPASYCGVAGYKPSFRLLPTVGLKCFSWSLDTVGFFGAGVADVAFAAAAVTGRELRVDEEALGTPRIALARTPLWADASADMQSAVERAGRAAEAAGARVFELDLPPLVADAFDAHGIIQDYEAARALASEFDRSRDRLGPILREQLANACAITPDAYDDARRIARRARHAFTDLMSETDVILTPSAPGAAPHGLGSTGASIFNRLWTLLGPPCINVPGLTDPSGLPLGVQIVGRFARDRTALRSAFFMEQALVRAEVRSESRSPA